MSESIPFMPAQHALRLEGLLLYVHLGCEAEERVQPQEVRVDIEFRFASPPAGVLSDELKDTVCYARVSEAVLKFCESREYKLIERLAYDVYGVAKEMAGPGVQVAVHLHKVRPPVERLRGGSHYLCGDFRT